MVILNMVTERYFVYVLICRRVETDTFEYDYGIPFRLQRAVRVAGHLDEQFGSRQTCPGSGCALAM